MALFPVNQTENESLTQTFSKNQQKKQKISPNKKMHENRPSKREVLRGIHWMMHIVTMGGVEWGRDDDARC